VLIEVDARGAHEGSVAFYEGNEKVWLADAVPVRFMRLVG
jgi:RNA:NAD 2'-phosphotransferase (TPT1/KptA family)